LSTFPWESLLDQLELELSASEDVERQTAICCRLALLHWDVRGDRQSAEHWVGRVEPGYGPSVELRRQLLLDAGQAAEAATLLEEQAAKREVPAALLAQAAMIWLLWCGDPEKAAACCQRAGQSGAGPDPDLGHLEELSVIVAGDAERLDALAGATTAGVPLLVAAARTQTRAEDSVALLERAAALDDEDPLLLELLLESSARVVGAERRVTLMQKKMQLLSRLGTRTSELLGLAFDLSRMLGELGQTEAAGELLSTVDPALDEMDVTEPITVNPLSWAGALLRLAKRDQAARQGDEAKLERVYRDMAEGSDVPALTRVYRLRVAQLSLSRDPSGRFAEEMLQANLQENPSDRHSARELERVLLRRREMGGLCALYQQQADEYPDEKGLMLRKAAVIAEAHLGNHGLAASLWRDCLALEPERSTHGDLQRLYRKLQSGPRLMEAYQREADEAPDAGTRSLLWSVLAALRLKLGQSEDAERAAREALEAMSDDPLALAVLIAVLEEQGRDDALKDALLRQAETLAAPASRATCLLRLAQTVAQPAEARRFLEQANELHPGDPAVLEALARSCRERGEHEDAVRWGLELAQAVDEQPARAAEAYVEVALTYEGQLKDAERAVQAYQKALTFEPRSVAALDGLCGIFRQRGDLTALSELLSRRLELAPPEEQKAGLFLELARVHEERGGELDDILAAYASAATSPEHRGTALGGLERMCRRAGDMDRLVRVLLTLPREGAVLEMLASAMEEIGDSEGLSTVLADLIEGATDELSRADRTYDLGRVLERLGKTSDAVTRYEQALESVQLHKPALKALQRLYRQEGQASALVRMLELELEVETDPNRRVEVLIELAHELEEAGQKGMATIRLEEALTLDPTNMEAIQALERLYDPSHPADLARVLAIHADLETEPLGRAALYLRAGEISASNRAMDQALPLLRSAFMSDPGNRTVFTTYEALCYEEEKWHNLMELYDRAIYFVESEGGKAYRPLDLFVRKGQLQLNHLGQPGEAVVSLLKALEQDPKSESVMKLLESIFLQQQDWPGLIRTYEHRATLVPNNELFRLESLRQAARLATGRLPSTSPEAAGLWEQIYSIDPTDEETLDSLERIYQDQGHHEQLADLLDTRLALAVADEDVVELSLRLAELSEKELEDPKRAARAYEGVRRIEEHHEQSLKALSRIYEATGEWEACVDVLKDLVIMEADPNERSLLYFKCGSIMESKFHEDEQAISYYEAALNETPACLPAIHGLRDLYLRREDWDKALDTLELEVQLWEEGKEQAGVLARMGEIRLNHLHDIRSAIDLFEDALAIDNDCQPAAMALFDLFYERGESRRALEMSERLVEKLSKEGDPQLRSRFFSRRGQLLAAGGDVADAVECLVTALDLRPDNLEALDWLIAICRRNPEAYDFATIFRDLEQVYRREENQAAVGHVLVAAGALSEIAGDAEAALARYQEAMESAPEEMSPVKSLANLLVRICRPLEAVTVLEKLVERTTDAQVRVRALLRVGEIWSDVIPDPGKAIHAYQRVLNTDPENQDALFRSALEYQQLGRLDEAQRRLSSLLDRSVDGRVRPNQLSRYAHHLGVVFQRRGDTVEATKQLQYALQLDSTNAAAAIALARMLERSGEAGQGRHLLTELLDVRPGRPVGGNRQGELDRSIPAGDLLEVRRCLAALSLNTGDVKGAVAQYETLISEAGKVEDRIALAETILERRGDVPAARQALLPVLEDDRFNPHALHLLADLYERNGEAERALLVLQVMEMLGWASRDDRVKLGALRRRHAIKPTIALDDGLRQFLAAFSSDRFVEGAWSVVCDSLEGLFPLELPGENVQPLGQVGQAEFRQLADWCTKFVAVEATLLVADAVPGGAAVDTVDGGRLVIDRLFLERPAAEVAFVLGRNLEYLRSGHSLLSRLAFDDRLLLGELLHGLLQSPESQNDLAQEFRRGVPRRTLKLLDEVAAGYRDSLAAGEEVNLPARWFTGVDRTANNTGLVSSNDIAAALRMVAQLSGQDLAVGPRGEVAVQLVADGPELVQFFLSEPYIKLRRKLARVD